MAGDQTVELDAVYLPVKAAEDVEDALEGYVRVTGKAAAGQSGPLVRGEGFEVDCAELETWPDDVLGEVVTVRGRLTKDGDQLKLERPLYEVDE
ncbi:MAG: hypothetical protein VYE22_20515 [Myxococcota bacterium]|nr:hypothetical protein [Myxococcota bacterium]